MFVSMRNAKLLVQDSKSFIVPPKYAKMQVGIVRVSGMHGQRSNYRRSWFCWPQLSRKMLARGVIHLSLICVLQSTSSAFVANFNEACTVQCCLNYLRSQPICMKLTSPPLNIFTTRIAATTAQITSRMWPVAVSTIRESRQRLRQHWHAVHPLINQVNNIIAVTHFIRPPPPSISRYPPSILPLNINFAELIPPERACDLSNNNVNLSVIPSPAAATTACVGMSDCMTRDDVLCTS